MQKAITRATPGRSLVVNNYIFGGVENEDMIEWNAQCRGGEFSFLLLSAGKSS